MVVSVVPLVQVEGLGLAVMGVNVELNVKGMLLALIEIGVVIFPAAGVVAGTLVVDSVPDRPALVSFTEVDAFKDGMDGEPDKVMGGYGTGGGSVIFELGEGIPVPGDTELSEGLPPVLVKVTMLVALVE